MLKSGARLYGFPVATSKREDHLSSLHLDVVPEVAASHAARFEHFKSTEAARARAFMQPELGSTWRCCDTITLGGLREESSTPKAVLVLE